MNNNRILCVLFMLLFAAPLVVVGQIRTPMASPPASVFTQVGLTDINIDYFRPKVKGRKIFGEGTSFLVPYGEIWRTGANSGSKISFSDDVKIMGTDVKAGEYLIFTIPGKNEWQVMLYNDLSIGGNTGDYDKSKEAGRFSVTPSATGETVEALTFHIEDLTADNTSANIALMWENTKVELPVTVSFDEKVMEAIAKGTRVNPGNLIAAANYYYETNRDLDKALEWVNTYLAENPNQFWNIHLKAKILAKKGDKKAAIETAQKSIEVAKAAGNDFGYIKRNEDLIAELKRK